MNASAVDRTKLIGLADRPGGDVKARLLLALTALYVERETHTDEEKRQYAGLAQRLLDVVDETTRSAVIAILQDHPSAPVEIVGRVAQIASPVRCRGGSAGQRPHRDPRLRPLAKPRRRVRRHLPPPIGARPSSRRRRQGGASCWH